MKKTKAVKGKAARPGDENRGLPETIDRRGVITMMDGCLEQIVSGSGAPS
jgi:hypothetical protein